MQEAIHMICDWCGKPADRVRPWRVKRSYRKWEIAGYYCNICYGTFRHMETEVRQTGGRGAEESSLIRTEPALPSAPRPENESATPPSHNDEGERCIPP